MLKRGNKRGLSTIVATLLIILLTLVAVGVIWIVVRNVIQGGAEQISLGKFTLDLEIKNVAINPATPNSIDVRIKRNAGEGEISGLKFIVDDGDITEVVEVNNFSLKELEEKTINLSLRYTNASHLQKVSVAPIFKLESGKEVTGDVKDEYEVPKSSGTTSSTGCLSSSECNDGNACTTNTCSGGVCSYPVITSCINNDGCCPTGCTSVNDNNCVQCANASQCNDSNSCTTDTCLAGVCSYPVITSCINNDACCPPGCTSVNDNNCVAVCGNGIKEGIEQCDGSDLGGATCASVMGTGYTGTLSCSSCTFVTSSCVLSTPSWQTGMVSWWRFNGNANDYFGRYNGTAVGATLTSTGCKSGQCYSFDGNNDYIYSNTFNLSGFSSLSASLWFKVFNKSRVQYLIYRESEFSIGLSDPGACSGCITFNTGGLSSNWDYWNTNSVITNNTWHNLVTTYDGSNKRLYIDGIAVGSPEAATGTIATNGLWEFFISLTGASSINGSIDEVMIFNRSLSSTEVQQIYNYAYP